VVDDNMGKWRFSVAIIASTILTWILAVYVDKIVKWLRPKWHSLWGRSPTTPSRSLAAVMKGNHKKAAWMDKTAMKQAKQHGKGWRRRSKSNVHQSGPDQVKDAEEGQAPGGVMSNGPGGDIIELRARPAPS
jgi:hypothetical protein